MHQVLCCVIGRDEKTQWWSSGDWTVSPDPQSPSQLPCFLTYMVAIIMFSCNGPDWILNHKYRRSRAMHPNLFLRYVYNILQSTTPAIYFYIEPALRHLFDSLLYFWYRSRLPATHYLSFHRSSCSASPCSGTRRRHSSSTTTGRSIPTLHHLSILLVW